MLKLRLLCVTMIGLTAFGCAAPGGASRDSRAAAAIADPLRLVILTGEGSAATWEQLISACAGADAVLIGECHGLEVGQAFQTKLFTDLMSRAPAASGALEFFERDEQAALDDYLSGVTSEAEFKRAARRTESNYTSGHRTIVEMCKANGRPVSAANAPRRYVRIARTEGFDRLRELSPEQRRLFVVPETMPEGRYRDDFFEVMGGEDLLAGDSAANEDDPKKRASDEKRREGIAAGFRSQSLWDWTMADSVARAIDEGGRPAVLVVGRFHIDHGGGLVQALEHLRPGMRVVTISSANEWADSLDEDDQGIADFVVFIGE